ncbi:NAD(P)-dependent oxidoreductase [Amycolatopsis suaedae]|uniref:NAD(P)-dependent oxidoreductase n=1 Tax=Amycolatopsis suaedae TaxID=2510978 RepID=A0A4Q7J804_9PSEU|nr:NAD(P)-binding domain-containing protein [Amycolatopsis suaedae]RZQ63811.1 NAD(P)-dependent oxidoreductase [Amycolatopsis suaedae]
MTEKNATGVTLIGLGPMGRAMVRRFLAGGHPTTVWNRTVSRADELVAEGAVPAGSVAQALAANELVVLSLTDYQAMYDILGQAEDALAGRVIVNLSSDTPQASRDAADWLAARGAKLVVGGVMVPEELVGTEQAYVFYSGPKAEFDRFEATLARIGRPDYRGEDHALAQLYYQAQLDMFLTALAAYLHANALVGSAGVSPSTFSPYAKETFDTLSYYFDDVVKQLEDGEYPGDGATVVMMGATADHIVGASEAAGVDTVLPKAVQSLYARTIAAGRGKEGWPSLIEVISGR